MKWTLQPLIFWSVLFSVFLHVSIGSCEAAELVYCYTNTWSSLTGRQAPEGSCLNPVLVSSADVDLTEVCSTNFPTGFHIIQGDNVWHEVANLTALNDHIHAVGMTGVTLSTGTNSPPFHYLHREVYGTISNVVDGVTICLSTYISTNVILSCQSWPVNYFGSCDGPGSPGPAYVVGRYFTGWVRHSYLMAVSGGAGFPVQEPAIPGEDIPTVFPRADFGTFQSTSSVEQYQRCLVYYYDYSVAVGDALGTDAFWIIENPASGCAGSLTNIVTIHGVVCDDLGVGTGGSLDGGTNDFLTLSGLVTNLVTYSNRLGTNFYGVYTNMTSHLGTAYTQIPTNRIANFWVFDLGGGRSVDLNPTTHTPASLTGMRRFIYCLSVAIICCSLMSIAIVQTLAGIRETLRTQGVMVPNPALVGVLALAGVWVGVVAALTWGIVAFAKFGLELLLAALGEQCCTAEIPPIVSELWTIYSEWIPLNWIMYFIVAWWLYKLTFGIAITGVAAIRSHMPG